jgi:hypothetical protein
MILRHIVGLAIALTLTWMLFFGANYFGAVWTHYFADEPPPPAHAGEVSVKIIRDPVQGPPPCAGCLSTPSPAVVRTITKQKPHE